MRTHEKKKPHQFLSQQLNNQKIAKYMLDEYAPTEACKSHVLGVCACPNEYCARQLYIPCLSCCVKKHSVTSFSFFPWIERTCAPWESGNEFTPTPYCGCSCIASAWHDLDTSSNSIESSAASPAEKYVSLRGISAYDIGIISAHACKRNWQIYILILDDELVDSESDLLPLRTCPQAMNTFPKKPRLTWPL